LTLFAPSFLPKKANFTLTETIIEAKKFYRLTETLAEKSVTFIFTKPLPRKDKPILKTYKAMSRQARQPTTNKTEATKQNQSKPKLTKPKPKNLDADFCDSIKPNRNFANKTKCC
jgi:hypothetical protein